MAMAKADMEQHERQYAALMKKARAAERAGLYQVAVKAALASWEHIDGMMRYERRYGENQEFASIPAIDMTLKYAPLLLDFESLNTLEGLLKACKRIEKNTSESLADKLIAARARMRRTHRLWDHLERNPGTRQDKLRQLLGGDQDEWRRMAEDWEKMGLLQRRSEGGSYRVALTTRMGEIVPAKCPACGNVVEAPKAMCLEDATCSECNAPVVFVLLSPQPLAET